VSRLSQMSLRSKLLLGGLVTALVAVGLLFGLQDHHQQPKQATTVTAMQYLQNHGLSKEQAAGIVGNLIQESGLNPESVQAGGPGRGIAQWTDSGQSAVPGRWNLLQAMAKSSGRSPYDLRLQLDFLWKDMQGKTGNGTLNAVRQAHTVAEATRAFETHYEASGMPNMRQRVTFAQDVYERAA
jgi:hypothetical protein